MRFKNTALIPYRHWLASLLVIFMGAGVFSVADFQPGTAERERQERVGKVERVDLGEKASQRPSTEKSDWPLWTSTRNQIARENAEAHWVKHRREFPEYRSAQEYIAGAHQFLRGPPAGTLFKSRENGDRLFYHPATNTFAVQAKSGAPRTMFRPRNGQKYWNRQ